LSNFIPFFSNSQERGWFYHRNPDGTLVFTYGIKSYDGHWKMGNSTVLPKQIASKIKIDGE